MVDAKRPIRRSATQKIFGGVLGGMAEWLEWDPSVARVAYFLLTAFTGFALGGLAYALLWIFLPVEQPEPGQIILPHQTPPPGVQRAS